MNPNAAKLEACPPAACIPENKPPQVGVTRVPEPA
jgi:hypothetical protein